MKIKNVNDLIEYCVNTNTKIICYGAGARAKQLANSELTRGLLKIIDVFVDQNKEIQKTGIIIGNKKYKVLPKERINEHYLNKSYIILITNCAFEEIMDDLVNKIQINEDRVFSLEILTFMEKEKLELERRIPENLRIYDYPAIPKVIHYCWFGKNPMPEKNKLWMKSWKEKCPDYEIIEWNESNYDVYKNKYMAQAYESGKWGFVPDYARLDIIYNNGGIYLDTDVELIKNYDDLLYQDAFAGFETSKYVALGLGFGSVKNNGIIKKMRDFYENITFFNDDGSMNLTPSPRYQTEILESLGLRLDGEYQNVSGMSIYPAKMFNGINMRTGEVSTTEYTKSIHHYDASWQTADYINIRNQRWKTLISHRL